MKKIIVAFILLMSMFFSVAEAALILEYDGAVRNYTGSVYELEVNGKRLTNLPLEPIIFNDRALVPVREIFEAMGATVDYEDKDKSITITHGKKSVFLKINSYKAKVNNVSTNIPDNVTPKLIAKWGESAKTMVPVRFISESIGMDVEFSEREGLISISDPDMVMTTPENYLKSITWAEDGDIVQVKVKANSAITQMTTPSVTEGGVLYTDIANMTYELENKTEIDQGAVIAVRLGTHDSSTRIAIDTDGMKKYSVELSSDKKTVIFKISANSKADIDTDKELPTDSPKPTTKPTRPSANPGDLIVVIDAGHGGSDPGVVRNRLTDEEMEEWLEVKDAPTPTPSPSATLAPSGAPSAEPAEDTDKKESTKETASPEPSATASPTIWDGGTGKLCKEKDIALSVAKKVKKLLEDKNIKVIMTREGDTYPTLDERPELAIKNGAVLFLSIHVNSTNDTVSNANGIEIYYSTQNNNDNYGVTSKDFAKEVLENVISSTKAKNRGVKTANYLVIRKGTMPSALIEMGFLNNPEELELLISDEYQDKIAKGISKGIINSLDDIEIKEEDEQELLNETEDE